MVGLKSQGLPGVATSVDDGGVGVEDPIGWMVLAQILPDILDRVQFGDRVGRQAQQADVGRDVEFAARPMPAGAVEDEDGVRAGGDLGADLRQVQVHRLDVDARQHQCGADAARRTDGAEQIGRGVALIARRTRAAALVGPDVGQASLLADACFILPPQLDRLAPSMLGKGRGDQLGEVFSCASWAAMSCSGWRGRTETRRSSAAPAACPRCARASPPRSAGRSRPADPGTASAPPCAHPVSAPHGPTPRTWPPAPRSACAGGHGRRPGSSGLQARPRCSDAPSRVEGLPVHPRLRRCLRPGPAFQHQPTRAPAQAGTGTAS